MKIRDGCKRRALLLLTGLGALFCLLVEFAVLLVQISPLPLIVTASRPLSRAAAVLVLGASITSSNTPSDALQDRLLTAESLYRSGYTDWILVTGDGGAYRSNETAVMKTVLERDDIPSDSIAVDPEGFRTYESCKRAAERFHLKKAIIITQRFHLARALFLCRSFGIEVQGVIADQQRYRNRWMFALRELGASVKAVMDVYLYAPESPVDLPQKPLEEAV